MQRCFISACVRHERLWKGVHKYANLRLRRVEVEHACRILLTMSPACRREWARMIELDCTQMLCSSCADVDFLHACVAVTLLKACMASSTELVQGFCLVLRQILLGLLQERTVVIIIALALKRGKELTN